MANVCPKCGLPRTTSEMMDLLQKQVEERAPLKEYKWCECTDQTPEAQQSRIDFFLHQALGDEDEDDWDDDD